MEPKKLSNQQRTAIQKIPKVGEVNYKAYNIAPNTIRSLIKLGIYEETYSGYIKRL